MKPFAFVLMAAVALSLAASCSDDDAIVDTGPHYQDLTLRDNLLANLEIAFEERSFEHYEELLDSDFLFRFSPLDVQQGIVPWTSWGRMAELGAVAHMFDSTYSRPGLWPVTKIELTLVYEAGEDKWTEVMSSGAGRIAAEGRYEKEVTYDFVATAGDRDFVGRGVNAVVVVKPVEVGGTQTWRIVAWYDSPLTSQGRSSPASEKITWGEAKALYCGDCRYGDLTERDHVLNNLGAAWNDRDLGRYVEILDDDFVFHFSAVEYAMGDVPYEQWERASEIAASRNLFDPGFQHPVLEPVSDIDLTLFYERGENTWSEVSPDDPLKYPGETWYEKLVTYSCEVKAGTMTYVGTNLHARFTVRPVASEECEACWRIVTCRDDVGVRSLRGDPKSPGLRSPAGVYYSWGRVKTVYSP